jgi:hypothetical protein
VPCGKVQALAAATIVVGLAVSVSAQPAPAPIAPPIVVSCLGARSYQVRASAPAGSRAPDGSHDAPYRSIGDALAAAASTRGCSVVVRVFPGTYPERLEITRPTEIIGEEQSSVVLTGGIRGTGPHALRVTRLTMRGTPTPAAIDVRHAQAQTTVDHVTFDVARDGAVRHLGGRVTVMNATIRGTVTGPAATRRGAAIRLEDAMGTIALTTVTGGDAQALVVRGPSAVAEVNELAVDDVAVPVRFASAERQFGGGVAAVEIAVRGRARLVGLRIRRAQGGGLLVDGGARVRAESTSVSDVRQIPETPPAMIFGIVARDATLHLVDFVLSGNRIGLVLLGAPFTGVHGEIRRSELGVVVNRMPAGWSLDDCFADVVATDNDLDLEMSELPVPDPRGICYEGGPACNRQEQPAGTCPNVTIP